MQSSKSSCGAATTLIHLRECCVCSAPMQKWAQCPQQNGPIINWILIYYLNEGGELTITLFFLPLFFLWHIIEFGEWFLNCTVEVSISSPECAGIWHWHIGLSDLFENMSPSFKTCCYRNIPWWIRSLSLVCSDPIQCRERCHVCWHVELVERFEICLHRGRNPRL